MNYYKKIYIPIFLSMLIHGFFIYLLTVKLSKPVLIDLESTMFVEIVRPEVEMADIIQRKMIESSHTLVSKGENILLKPMEGLTMTSVYNKKNTPQKPHVSRRAIEMKVGEPMAAQKTKMPVTMKSKLSSPQVFSKSTNHDPKYSIEAEKEQKMVVFNYSKPLAQGNRDTAAKPRYLPYEGLAGFNSPAVWVSRPSALNSINNVTLPDTIANVENNYLLQTTVSFQKTSTVIPRYADIQADQRFRTMVIGKIENAKIYPESARKREIEGDVFVKLSIFPDGKVDNIQLIPPTTKHIILKESTINTIRNAAPYLPIPIELKRKDTIAVNLKISYRLE